jgi:carboxylate-amine ligase
VAIRDLIRELLDFVDDVVDDLKSRPEISYIETILKMGTGADRQLRVYRDTNDLKKVVDTMIEETHLGLN